MDLADDMKCVTMVEVKDLICQTVPVKARATKSGHVGPNFKKFRKVLYPPCAWNIVDKEVFSFTCAST